MNTNLNLAGFVDLAVALGKPIVLFDLECTTFRGRPNFGITEASFLTAVPAKGATGVVQYGSLVNPEAKIDPKVVELTGITQKMVAAAEPWNKRYMQHFAEWAPRAYFTGFNTSTFDLPAVKDQAKRYGGAVPEFPFEFDVRKLHLKLSGAESQKGTLQEVAAQYGVTPRGSLHRATADVALTAETLSVMAHAYGIEALLELIVSPVKDPSTVLSAYNVARFVQSQRARSLSELAALFKVDESKVAYEAGKAVDEGLLDNPFVLEDTSAQSWLVPAVNALPEDAKNCGRLKQIHDALGPLCNGVPIDYVQLRLALLKSNLRWSSLRIART
jgi:DNA polymerase III alpha subunit (gram-positive type)